MLFLVFNQVSKEMIRNFPKANTYQLVEFHALIKILYKAFPNDVPG